jgi:hypothetical protein
MNDKVVYIEKQRQHDDCHVRHGGQVGRYEDKRRLGGW